MMKMVIAKRCMGVYARSERHKHFCTKSLPHNQSDRLAGMDENVNRLFDCGRLFEFIICVLALPKKPIIIMFRAGSIT